MNRQEAAKLLSLIKLSYPTAYRDIDKETAGATVNMWQMSFPDVPYPIIEQAFNHFRMVSKFPPTVAEMVEELQHIHYQALEKANICRILGDQETQRKWLLVMERTERYKDTYNLGGLNMDSLRGKIGDGHYGSAYQGLTGGAEGRNELRPVDGIETQG